ncbi:hypothetical protein [Paenibacillus sp. 1P07SE]|uniref:hypothetical protein n=1 Tax=Paenibacillus sp. 1P07SE TaxID=3132209 RepID=UPI0039A4D212
MRIMETKLASKTGDPDTCEDRYCLTEHYACVIDGATDVSGKRYGNRTSGQVIASALEEGVRALPPGLGIEQLMKQLNERLIQTYQELGMYDEIQEHPHSIPSASMALYSPQRHQVWMIGDCQCMLDGELYSNEKKVDSITAYTRSMLLESEVLRGKTIAELMESDPSRGVIRPLIQAQYVMQNTAQPSQYGYVAVTGFEFDLGQIKMVDVPAATRELVLASDGYPLLRPTLAESEAELQRILETDPLCFREYKLAKGLQAGNESFDDRTYVRLELPARG